MSRELIMSTIDYLVNQPLTYKVQFLIAQFQALLIEPKKEETKEEVK